jgi:TonB family protein
MKIRRSGEISEVRIEKRSGNRYFDESVLKAIRKAGALPPLPEWFGANSLDVTIRFHSSELKP